MKQSNWIQWAALLGLSAVAIGAFGAHGLKPHLNEYQIQIYETGVQYMFYHALALLATGVLQHIKGDNNSLKWAGRLFIGGIACFSGSLFLLATRDLLAFPVGWAGPVTPIGGVMFMAGWLSLFLAVRKG